MTWEYVNLKLCGGESEDDMGTLDRYGDDGWELVSVSNGVAYMKRPKQEVS